MVYRIISLEILLRGLPIISTLYFIHDLWLLHIITCETSYGKAKARKMIKILQ